MKGYLLDTDIVVFILRNHFKAVNRLKELSPSEIYISEVTVAELEYGNHCSGRYDENKLIVDSFLSEVNIIPFSESISFYAKERFRLRKLGQSIMDFDLIIASTSVAKQLVMVTNNVNHFKRVEGIRIDNWME